MPEKKEGCVEAAAGPILAGAPEESSAAETSGREVERKVVARVGQPAPDFEAIAYVEGGFKSIKLSDYKDRWVVICFYPGDFTFV